MEDACPAIVFRPPNNDDPICRSYIVHPIEDYPFPPRVTVNGCTITVGGYGRMNLDQCLAPDHYSWGGFAYMHASRLLQKGISSIILSLAPSGFGKTFFTSNAARVLTKKLFESITDEFCVAISILDVRGKDAYDLLGPRFTEPAWVGDRHHAGLRLSDVFIDRTFRDVQNENEAQSVINHALNRRLEPIESASNGDSSTSSLIFSLVVTTDEGPLGSITLVDIPACSSEFGGLIETDMTLQSLTKVCASLGASLLGSDSPMSSSHPYAPSLSAACRLSGITHLLRTAFANLHLFDWGLVLPTTSAGVRAQLSTSEDQGRMIDDLKKWLQLFSTLYMCAQAAIKSKKGVHLTRVPPPLLMIPNGNTNNGSSSSLTKKISSSSIAQGLKRKAPQSTRLVPPSAIAAKIQSLSNSTQKPQSSSLLPPRKSKSPSACRLLGSSSSVSTFSHCTNFDGTDIDSHCSKIDDELSSAPVYHNNGKSPASMRSTSIGKVHKEGSKAYISSNVQPPNRPQRSSLLNSNISHSSSTTGLKFGPLILDENIPLEPNELRKPTHFVNELGAIVSYPDQASSSTSSMNDKKTSMLKNKKKTDEPDESSPVFSSNTPEYEVENEFEPLIDLHAPLSIVEEVSNEGDDALTTHRSLVTLEGSSLAAPPCPLKIQSVTSSTQQQRQQQQQQHNHLQQCLVFPPPSLRVVSPLLVSGDPLSQQNKNNMASSSIGCEAPLGSARYPSSRAPPIQWTDEPSTKLSQRITLLNDGTDFRDRQVKDCSNGGETEFNFSHASNAVDGFVKQEEDDEEELCRSEISDGVSVMDFRKKVESADPFFSNDSNNCDNHEITEEDNNNNNKRDNPILSPPLSSILNQSLITAADYLILDSAHETTAKECLSPCRSKSRTEILLLSPPEQNLCNVFGHNRDPSDQNNFDHSKHPEIFSSPTSPLSPNPTKQQQKCKQNLFKKLDTSDTLVKDINSHPMSYLTASPSSVIAVYKGEPLLQSDGLLLNSRRVEGNLLVDQNKLGMKSRTDLTAMDEDEEEYSVDFYTHRSPAHMNAPPMTDRSSLAVIHTSRANSFNNNSSSGANPIGYMHASGSPSLHVQDSNLDERMTTSAGFHSEQKSGAGEDAQVVFTQIAPKATEQGTAKESTSMIDTYFGTQWSSEKENLPVSNYNNIAESSESRGIRPIVKSYREISSASVASQKSNMDNTGEVRFSGINNASNYLNSNECSGGGGIGSNVNNCEEYGTPMSKFLLEAVTGNPLSYQTSQTLSTCRDNDAVIGLTVQNKINFDCSVSSSTAVNNKASTQHCNTTATILKQQPYRNENNPGSMCSGVSSNAMQLEDEQDGNRILTEAIANDKNTLSSIREIVIAPIVSSVSSYHETTSSISSENLIPGGNVCMLPAATVIVGVDENSRISKFDVNPPRSLQHVASLKIINVVSPSSDTISFAPGGDDDNVKDDRASHIQVQCDHLRTQPYVAQPLLSDGTCSSNVMMLLATSSNSYSDRSNTAVPLVRRATSSSQRLSPTASSSAQLRVRGVDAFCCKDEYSDASVTEQKPEAIQSCSPPLPTQYVVSLDSTNGLNKTISVNVNQNGIMLNGHSNSTYFPCEELQQQTTFSHGQSNSCQQPTASSYPQSSSKPVHDDEQQRVNLNFIASSYYQPSSSHAVNASDLAATTHRGAGLLSAQHSWSLDTICAPLIVSDTAPPLMATLSYNLHTDNASTGFLTKRMFSEIEPFAETTECEDSPTLIPPVSRRIGSPLLCQESKFIKTLSPKSFSAFASVSPTSPSMPLQHCVASSFFNNDYNVQMGIYRKIPVVSSLGQDYPNKISSKYYNNNTNTNNNNIYKSPVINGATPRMSALLPSTNFQPSQQNYCNITNNNANPTIKELLPHIQEDSSTSLQLTSFHKNEEVKDEREILVEDYNTNKFNDERETNMKDHSCEQKLCYTASYPQSPSMEYRDHQSVYQDENIINLQGSVAVNPTTTTNINQLNSPNQPSAASEITCPPTGSRSPSYHGFSSISFARKIQNLSPQSNYAPTKITNFVSEPVFSCDDGIAMATQRKSEIGSLKMSPSNPTIVNNTSNNSNLTVEMPSANNFSAPLKTSRGPKKSFSGLNNHDLHGPANSVRPLTSRSRDTLSRPSTVATVATNARSHLSKGNKVSSVTPKMPSHVPRTSNHSSVSSSSIQVAMPNQIGMTLNRKRPQSTSSSQGLGTFNSHLHNAPSPAITTLTANSASYSVSKYGRSNTIRPSGTAQRNFSTSSYQSQHSNSSFSQQIPPNSKFSTLNNQNRQDYSYTSSISMQGRSNSRRQTSHIPSTTKTMSNQNLTESSINIPALSNSSSTVFPSFASKTTINSGSASEQNRNSKARPHTTGSVLIVNSTIAGNNNDMNRAGGIPSSTAAPPPFPVSIFNVSSSPEGSTQTVISPPLLSSTAIPFLVDQQNFPVFHPVSRKIHGTESQQLNATSSHLISAFGAVPYVKDSTINSRSNSFTPPPPPSVGQQHSKILNNNTMSNARVLPTTTNLNNSQTRSLTPPPLYQLSGAAPMSTTTLIRIPPPSNVSTSPKTFARPPFDALSSNTAAKTTRLVSLHRNDQNFMGTPKPEDQNYVGENFRNPVGRSHTPPNFVIHPFKEGHLSSPSVVVGEETVHPKREHPQPPPQEFNNPFGKMMTSLRKLF